MKRIRSLLGAFAVLAVIGGAMVVAAPSAFAGNTVFVNGTSIQAAVNAAAPGTTIIVSPGTYNESVLIQKNGIHLRGSADPLNPTVLDGTGVGNDPVCGIFGPPVQQDGICIAPPGGVFTSPRITNIEIDHFTVQNYNATGIIAFSAEGLNFHDNIVSNADEYGIARFDSSHTQIVNNTVSGAEEAGIYVGDSPNASALVRGNTATGNGLGIFLRDSAHGTVTENTATGNCWGILLLDTDNTSASDVWDWTLVHNNASDNTEGCPPGEGPPESGAGIVVVGARNSRITANTTDNNDPDSHATAASGGIVVVGTSVGSQAPAFLQIDNNHTTGNVPTDLYWDTSGTKIVFTRNTCNSSAIPANLCSL